LVPSTWPIEVANVLAVGERHKRLPRIEASQFLRLLDHFPIEVDSRSPSAAMRDVLGIAREYRSSAYDVCYIELAIRANLPLATLDKSLRKVAANLQLVKLHPKSMKER
jgi:predicted nucleic acid-binding protein